MSQPANFVLTRGMVWRAGYLDSDHLIEIDEMNQAQRNEALISGLKGLQSLSVSLNKFDGTTNIKDWLEEYNDYIQEAAKESDNSKLFAFQQNLSGEATQWLQLQPDSAQKDYANLRKALFEKFSPAEQELFCIKRQIYSSSQQALQSFKDHVRQLQVMARSLKLAEKELVGVCINGAHPTLKAHLAMSGPDTIEALLKLPMVVNEIVSEEPMLIIMLQALTTTSQQFEAAHQSEKLVRFGDKPRHSAGSSRENSPAHAPGDRDRTNCNQGCRSRDISWTPPPNRRAGWTWNNTARIPRHNLASWTM